MPPTQTASKHLVESPFSKPEYACTVVNFMPISIIEPKPHMIPSHFVIPKAQGDIPGLAYIKEGVTFIPNPLIEEGKPGSTFRQITTPMEMARSICEDYNAAHIALTDDAKPGLFWVEGRMNWEEVQKYHPTEVETAKRQQYNWFRNLINMADSDWQKNKNMSAVSDLQRIAANAMGVKKEWVNWIEPDALIKCPYCKVDIDKDSVLCANCKQVVNQAKLRELQTDNKPTPTAFVTPFSSTPEKDKN